MAHSSKEYMRDYMQGYRKSQCERAAQKNGQLSDAYDILREEFIEDKMNQGYTRDQCEEYLRNYVAEETQLCGTATDSAPEKPKCFGQKRFTCDCNCPLKGDCHDACVAESVKPQAQKDAERNAKIMKFLAESKELVRQSELRDLVAVADAFIAIEKQKQIELDTLTKKYVDRGVPEKAALESATAEQKQLENVETQKRMKSQHDWDLMTKEEQTAYKWKVIKDSKKLLEGSK